ncbi:MAG: polysaccharide deacetylase family protein, partial [Pygmaiobacter sp.]
MFYSFRIKKSCALAVLGAAVTALALGTCFAGNQEDYCCTAEVLSAVSTALPAAENIESGERTAYLSFDDGPSATTESVLNTLKGKGVPATFFVCAAENNEPYLPLLARTAAEGHQIGLHSCSHSYKTIYASPEAFWSDL